MGLAVKTQYHINGPASHRYWKLVTLPQRAHLFYCSHAYCTFTGFTFFGVHFSLQNLYTCRAGRNGWLAKLMYNFNSSGYKTVKTIFYVVICGERGRVIGRGAVAFKVARPEN